MNGQMMQMPLLTSSLLVHAERHHADEQIVSRRVEGDIHRYTYADLAQTRDYLVYLRATMGQAARNLEPFDEAYARTDWSRFAGLPLFAAANRMNAYNTYLLMEHEAP